MSALLAGGLSGLAVLVTGLQAPSRLIVRHPPRPAPGRTARLDPAWAPLAACVLAALAAVLLVGGLPGFGLGLLVVLVGPGVVAELEPAAVRADRQRLSTDLPSALDLLAACLAGGAPAGAAAAAVAVAVGGPVERRLAEVAARLEVGSAAPYAWAALAGDGLDEDAASAARTLARASDGGAPVAAAVARLAADARVRARSRGERAAARASVLGVAPLGLCFLPAFVLIGIVPVVVGLIGPALRGV
jgi:pilus assembly protein TadC